jgi:hypothetical protein
MSSRTRLHDHPIPYIWLTEHTHLPAEPRIDQLRKRQNQDGRHRRQETKSRVTETKKRSVSSETFFWFFVIEKIETMQRNYRR